MKKIALLIIAIIGLVFFIGCLMFLILPVEYQLQARETEENDYTKKTSPLMPEVVDDICQKFKLPIDDNRCQPGAVTYAPEFFDDIEVHLLDGSDGALTYEEVDQLLKPYLFWCDPPSLSNNGRNGFTCTYDLRGDNVSIIMITFQKDGSIKKILTSVGGS